MILRHAIKIRSGWPKWLVILLLPLSTLGRVAKGAEDKPKDARLEAAVKLFEALKEVKDAHDKVFELRDALRVNLDNAEKGEPPKTLPAQTALGGKMEEALNALKKKIAAFDVQQLVPTNPKTVGDVMELSDREFTKRSAALAQAVDFMMSDHETLLRASGNAAALAENLENGEAVKAALVVVAKSFDKLMDTTPALLATPLGMAWFDAHFVIKKSIFEINSNIAALHSDVVSEIERCGQRAATNVANLLLQIRQHEDRMDAEVRNLPEAAAKLKMAVRLLEHDKEMLEISKGRQTEVESAVKEAKKGVDEIKARQVATTDQLKKDERDRIAWQRNVDAPFTLCENGHPFKRCEHTELKARFVREQDAARAQVGEINRRLDPAASAIAKSRLDRDLTRAQDRLKREDEKAKSIRSKVDFDTKRVERSEHEISKEAARQKELEQSVEIAKQASAGYAAKLRELQMKIQILVEQTKSPK